MASIVRMWSQAVICILQSMDSEKQKSSNSPKLVQGRENKFETNTGTSCLKTEVRETKSISFIPKVQKIHQKSRGKVLGLE